MLEQNRLEKGDKGGLGSRVRKVQREDIVGNKWSRALGKTVEDKDEMTRGRQCQEEKSSTKEKEVESRSEQIRK